MNTWLFSLLPILLGLAFGWSLKGWSEHGVDRDSPVLAAVAQEAADSEPRSGAVQEPLRGLQVEEVRSLLCSSVNARELRDWCALLSIDELQAYLLSFTSEAEMDQQAMGFMCALTVLGEKDWARAVQCSRGMGKDMGDMLLGYLLGGLASHDSARALTMLQEFKLKDDFSEGAFYTRWLEQDAAAVLRYWDEHPDTGSSTHSLKAYAQLCPAAELPALARAAAGLKRKDLAASAVRSVSEVWSAYQPAAAIQFLTQYAQGSGEGDEILSIMSERFHTLGEFPLEYMRVTEALPAGATRTAMSKGLVSHLLAKGEYELLSDWLAAHPDPAVEKRLLDHPLLPTGKDQLLQLHDRISTPEDGQSFLSAAVISLARSSDHDSALQLLQEMQPGKAAETAVEELAQQWYRYEPEAALQWALAFEPSGERDAAVAGVTQIMIEMDPAQAAPYVSSIQDEGRRQFMLRELSKAWRVADPVGLRQWLLAQPGMNNVLLAEMLR